MTWFINYRKKYNQSYLVLVCRVEVSSVLSVDLLRDDV